MKNDKVMTMSLSQSLFLEGQTYLIHFLFSFSCYRFIEKVLKMKLNTFVKKYTDIIIFIFGYIIYH